MDDCYWNQVTKEESGILRCKCCEHTFKGVSKIKANVNPIPGQGIAVCYIDCECDNQGIHNTIISGSSNNPQEAVNASSPLQEVAVGTHETIETTGGLIDVLEGSAPTDVMNGRSIVNGTFQIEISDLNQLISDLSQEESDMEGQLQWLESQGKKRKRQVDNWMNELKDLKRRVVDINNSVDQLGLSDLYGPEIMQFTKEVQRLKEQKPTVLSNIFVGTGFQENVKKMLKLLMDDKVLIIGIHGMGGVGKTLLAIHMMKEIERKGTFNDVVWVTVSYDDDSILRMQNNIAEKIGVELPGNDEIARSRMLSSALVKRGKSVLIILDDVWEYIDVEKVGIPVGAKGIKLILTGRLRHVHKQMDCDNIITMHPLSDEEAWELFLLKLGYRGMPATLHPEVLVIARYVARKCDGLPLGISVIARTMKGVSSIHRWKYALNKLENLEMREKVEEVFKVLKCSYDNLEDKDLQNCFLYCALLDGQIDREEVTMRLVDSGLINWGIRSLEEIFDEGYFTLYQLEAHSLLLSTRCLEMLDVVRDMACHILKESTRCLEMQDVVRDMARHILKESHSVIVKCGKKLRKIPRVQEWTADLKVVSLIDNKIEEIPNGTSPYCPRLSTLLLNRNEISRIAECFFTHMNSLAVLDLSDNAKLTCLPNSVSNLRSLTSLVLKQCYALEYVPPLGELQALLRLVISGTSINRLPEGLENLICLKWLDLSYNDKLKLVAGSVLSGLTNLRYLDLRSSCYLDSSIITVKDVEEMSMLEWIQV